MVGAPVSWLGSIAWYSGNKLRQRWVQGSSEGKFWPLQRPSRSKFPVSRKNTPPRPPAPENEKRHFKNLTFHISITALKYYNVDHLDL